MASFADWSNTEDKKKKQSFTDWSNQQAGKTSTPLWELAKATAGAGTTVNDAGFSHHGGKIEDYTQDSVYQNIMDARAARESAQYGGTLQYTLDGWKPRVLDTTAPQASAWETGIKPVQSLMERNGTDADYLTETGFDDPLYAAINGSEDAQTALFNQATRLYGAGGTNPLGMLFGGSAKSRSELLQMTQDEIDTFNYIYATNGRDAAHDYYDRISGDLNYRQRLQEEAKWKQYAEERPGAASALSVLGSPLKGLSYAGQMVDYMEDRQIDENAAYNKFSYTPTAIRAQVSDTIEKSGKWGKVGSFAYNTGMSMGDFLLNTAVTGGNEALSLTLMGMNAAADTVLAKKAQGYSDDRAFILGTLAGAVEAATEKIGFDALFKSGLVGLGKEGLRQYLIRNMASEGAEEGLSDILNWGVDALYDVISGENDSEWKRRMRELQSHGMSRNEALGVVVAEHAEELGLDMAGGALSGGVMAGVGGAGMAINYNRTGRAVNNTFGTDAVQDLVNLGLKNDQSTQSYQYANEIQARLARGEQVSNLEVGQLFSALQADNAENEAGIISRETTPGPVDEAYQIAMGRANALSNYNTALEQNGAFSSEEIQARQGVYDAMVSPAAQITREQVRAIASDPAQLQALGIDTRGKDGAQIRAEVRAALEAQEQSRVNEETRRVDNMLPAQDTPTTLYDLGQQAEGTYGGQGYTGEDRLWQLAQEAARQETEQQNATETPQQMQGRFATLRAAAEEVARTQVAQQAQQQAERQAPQQSVRSNEPGLVRDEVAKKANLTNREARAIDALGRVIGKKIRFAESLTAELRDEDGTVRRSSANAQIEGDTITISLQSEDPFLVAAVHEVVHGIRDVDEEAYQALANFVTNNMSDRASFYATMEQAKMGYSREQIPEETVATAFGRMLGDEKTLRQFVSENTTAAERFMDALRDLLDKIRQILTGSKRETNTLTENQRAVYKDLEGRLDKMLLYFTDALNAVKESENTEGSGETRYALMEKDIESARENKPEKITLAADQSYQEDNIRKGKGAVRDLLERSKKSNNPENLAVRNAMYRSNIGQIDIVWGTPGVGEKFKKGYGLSHIIAKRDAEAGNGVQTAYKAIDTIALATEGDMQKGTIPGNERIRLSYDGFTVVLSKMPGDNSWLLTGWKNNEPAAGATGEGHNSSGATADAPTFTRRTGENATDSTVSIEKENASVKKNSRKRYSLKSVEPVQPKTDAWQRGATYDEVKAAHPTLYELNADENESRNPTQVTVTQKSYRKIYRALQEEGFDGTILDASSGLGLGTQVGRDEFGYDVEDIEPFPDKSYEPMYTDYSTLNNTYDVIISNAVLNVLPQDLRDDLTVKMGEMLNPGGRLFVNVRGSDVKNAKSKVPINEGQMEYFIEDGASYQKGFTKNELKAYLEDALGAGYAVEPTNQFGAVSAVVTKDGAANVLQTADRKVGVEVDEKSESAAPVRFSLASHNRSDYVTDRENAAKDLAARLGVSVKKAKGYIDAVNSVAKMIADDRVRLDYESSPGRSSFVGNSEYGGSIDFSTICKKRRLYTGTIDAIQNAMPNKALTADEMLKIRAEMKKRGYEVSCGLCYVEGSRVNIGTYTQEFLDEIKQGGGYVPTMAEINTTEGQEKLRAEHPEVYEQYVKYMNKLAQRKPKLFQMATEYQGEILKKFKNDSTVETKNKNGGLRLQSFSDFEIIHLIDCMQVIMDMSRVGLAGQAYTKVPDFAWALGGTGLKINLSMIAKGVENGKIVFDEIEGMKQSDAKALRDKYSKNVGTILVVFNDEQLKAALNDGFVDFIIPFHRSQWNKGQYEMLGLPEGAQDYTLQQNESYLDGRKDKNGKTLRPANFMPNEYWDFNKTGKENAEEYLRMCAEDGRRPKFYKILDDNGDGTYSLKKDGSTDGYWKLLTDFKMYDNSGKGSPQMPVRPEFNMEEAERMLRDYQGGHAKLPVAQDIVDDFVNRRFSRSGRDVLDELIEQYGPIDAGENPVRDVPIPKRTTDKTKVSMTIRTVAEAGATPEEYVPTIENLVANHEFDYTPYSDKKAIANANSYVSRKGYQSALAEWEKTVGRGEVSKTNTAVGWALYNNAVNSGDTENALQILRDIVAHQRNAAQAVQATRILKQLNPETQLYNAEKTVEQLNDDLRKKYGDKAPELEIDRDLAERFLRARSDEGRAKAMSDIYKDIGRQMPTRFLDRWNAWRYLAMLGNPRTHLRNIFGNAGFAPVVAAKDIVATGIEAAVDFVSGGKLNRTKGVAGADLMKAAWNDYANIREQALGEGKYSDSQLAQKEINDARRIFGNTKSKLWNKSGGAVLERARKLNGDLLDKEDVAFSKPHYTLALAQYCAANHISAAQIRSGKGIETARQYAIREAQKATYRDTNSFSEAVSRLGRGAQWQNNKTTKLISMAVEGILPFRKTPANILVRGVEYSPLGLLKSISYDLAQVKKGNMSGADMIDHLAAGLTGTGLLALGTLLASQGILRGRGGDDEKKKKFDDLTGHQDYAIEFGDGTSITLDWLAPEALPLFMGANLVETARERNGNMKLADILSAIGNVTEPMLEMSCLQSLNAVFDTVGYAKEGDVNALTKALASAATSYLTQALPTIGGQAERTGETKRMTTYTDKNKWLTGDMQYTIGKISAKIPFGDYQQIPYIDAWGREETTGGFAARLGNNFFNPAFLSKVNESDMEKELERLYKQTGESKVFPQRPDKYITVDGERKDLTADEYVTYATNKGRTAYTVVGNMTNTAMYKAMSDAEKVEAIDDAYDYAKYTAITAVGGKVPVTYTWIEKAKTGVSKGINPETYILIKSNVSGIESLKDKEGNTIDNSKGLQIMEAIYSVPGLTDDQRYYLFSCYKDVGKKIIDLNKAAVQEKLKIMRK